MHATMQPYAPALYLPGSLGRFRAYPYRTKTPIPGAGYDASRLVWAEQELDLSGRGTFADGRGGSCAAVPLRGIGSYYGSLGQTPPASAGSLPERFFRVGMAIWGSPPQQVDYNALVEYGKVAAVGTFVGIPLALIGGYLLGGAAMHRKMRANRVRRRSRR